jgi:hypothetical protein
MEVPGTFLEVPGSFLEGPGRSQEASWKFLEGSRKLSGTVSAYTAHSNMECWVHHDTILDDD